MIIARQVFAGVLALGLCLALGADAAASDPDTAGMKRVFDALEKAVRASAEADFEKHWHPAGYATNLVGGSGLPGKRVFEQGSRKGWFLKPDLDKLQALPGRLGGPWIVRCDVWSWKKERAVDEIHALLVHMRGKTRKMVMLGGGERLEEVIALGRRWVDKKPLAPKKR